MPARRSPEAEALTGAVVALTLKVSGPPLSPADAGAQGLKWKVVGGGACDKGPCGRGAEWAVLAVGN
jgi:hypothetical protein